MIKLFQPFVPETLKEPLLETLYSGYITQGPKVEEFEKLFGLYHENPNAVSVNSGTSAITLALRVAGVRAGDEVITTPMTCSASNLPILSLGAIPVFADIDPKTGLIDPQSVKKKVTPKTKAILCVDWGGQPCDLNTLSLIAKKHKLKLVEDAAHAIGAEYDGQKIGSIADFTCFSFQAIKHITTVDGGMILCKSEQDMKKAKLLRWFGINRETNSKDTRIDEDILDWGYKFHMNDVAAAMGIEQMNHVKRVVAGHRANAWYYDRTIYDDVGKPSVKTGSSFWLYTLTFPSRMIRNNFKDYMLENNVQVSQVHKRNDEYTVFKPFEVDLPKTGVFNNTMCCIPVHFSLTSKEVAYIAKTVNKFIDEYRGHF